MPSTVRLCPRRNADLKVAFNLSINIKTWPSSLVVSDSCNIRFITKKRDRGIHVILSVAGKALHEVLL